MRHCPQRDGFFFEAGGFDGIFQSNTAYLERYRGWRGILVEPIPHKFVECVGNRPKAQIVHGGLVAMGDDRPHVEVIYGNAMTLTTDSAYDHTAHVAAAANCAPSDEAMLFQRFLAPATTVDSILADYRYTQIDLFSLDVEGAEIPALRGIDFTRTRPHKMLIETDDLPSVACLLQTHGYRQAETIGCHDYIFEPV